MVPKQQLTHPIPCEVIVFYPDNIFGIAAIMVGLHGHKCSSVRNHA